MKLSTTITALMLAAPASAQNSDSIQVDSSQQKVPEDIQCQLGWPEPLPLKVTFTKSTIGPAGEKIEPKTVQTKDPCLKCGKG